MGQRTLDEDIYSSNADDDGGRPDAEAAAVAGDATPHVGEVVDTGDVRVPDRTGQAAVELMVTAVDYTVEGRGSDEYPVVHVFGRTADDELEHVRVVGVEPYFYVPTPDVADRELTEEYDVVVDTRRHPHGDPDADRFESIRGDPVTKIVTRTPRDVGQIRDDFETTYEADILFPNRFLIDHGVTAGIRVEPRRLSEPVHGDDDSEPALQVTPDHLEPVDVDANLRVNTFDIEVDDRNGFPENGEEPIVCLTSHDSYRDEYVLWLYDAPDGDGSEATDEELLDAFADYEFISGDADVRLERFETEEAMLDSYLSYISRTDPDVSTGWNCLPEDTDVQMGDGSVKQIKNVEVGDQVVGEEDQSTTTAEVIDRWESHKSVLELQLADGTTLRSSEDHRVMVGDETDVSWTEAGEVAVGDYVLKPRKLRVEDPEVPKLRELVPREFHRFTDPETVSEFKSGLPRGAVLELSEEFGVSKETLYHPNTTVWTPDRCAHAAQQFDTALPDGGVEYRQSGRNLDTELSAHEAYLAGLVLTDGSMSRDDGVRFYNTKPALHEQFDDDPHLEPDWKGCYKQNVLDFSRMWAFNGLGIPFGDKNDSEVDLSTVYQMPVRYVAQFMAGVIDGDGSVNDTVTVAAENGTTGEWYVRLFKRLGVYAERNENVVRVPDSERDLSVVREHVLPHMSHPEKTSELRDLVGGKSGRSENIPNALFEAPEGTDRRRIGRDKHRRGINLKRHETDNTEWEEFVFVEVESTTTVGTETTYDLETSTNNFVADGCLVHNCDDFDAPYLFDRMEELNPTTEYDLSPDRTSRVDETWRSSWGGPDVKGRVVFDLLYAYQRTQFSELDSYRLDAVAEVELGVGKERYTGDIGDLWEEDPTRLLEYNLRDVELCVEIDRQQNLIDFWDDTRKFVGCQLADAPTPGDVVDMYVLHEAYGEFVLPTKGQQAGEEFEGGAVFDPISGVEENVSVLDLKCFSRDTELVTPDGARGIDELEAGDEIYTLNPDTFECEVKPVAETHQYHNEYGELHHLSGNTHDLKVTENHRFVVSDTRGWDDQQPDDFETVAYRDIPGYERFAFPQHEPMSGRSPETFDLAGAVTNGHVSVYGDSLTSFRNAVPDSVTAELDYAQGTSAKLTTQKRVTKYLVPVETYHEHREVIEREATDVYLKYDRGHSEVPTTVPMDQWLELIGWYVTEGSLDRSNGCVTIHQSDEENREDICRLLDDLAVQYNTDERGVYISNRILVDWFEQHCGVSAEQKRLPDWTFDLDGSLLETLLDTMIRGDGSRTESGLGKFWTKSDDLKDDFLDLAVRCGEKPSVAEEAGGMWYVSAGKRGSFKKETNATVEDHDGDVFCVTAEDNHVVLAGRNGNFQWVGQSLYPMCMVTINASPETIVDDPESYDGETYRAPNGTRFRKEPDGMMREMVDELLIEREELKGQRNQHDPNSEEYEKFDRQQQSVKVIMNCFTSDTDVLTPDGIQSITDLDVGDEVYSLDPDTMEMEVQPVEETHEYPDYRGELIDIETSKVDFRVTPNHRMLVRKAETNGIEWDEDDYRFVEAGELDDATNYQLPHGWDGPDGTRLETVDLTEFVEGEYQVWADNDAHGHTLASEVGYYPDKIQKADRDTTGYVFSRSEFDEHRSYLEAACSEFLIHREANRKWVPMRYDGDDFLELLAWYITEGSVYTSEEKEFGESLRGSATSVQIAQAAPTATDGGVGVETADSDHSQIGNLLDRMGFDYYVDENGYQFTSRLWGEFLERTCGEDSFEKRVPEFVFETSRDQKRSFLETLIAGDGDRQKNAWRYSTASETLRDDVLRLCAHLGLTANYTEDEGGTYRIYVTEDSQNTLRMHRSSSRSTAEDGVYCVTVADNHTLLAGRNGKFQFVGQSLYGVSGWEQFRLYDKDNAAAITAMGRRVIEFTEEAADEIGYDVTYGDSVTGDRPLVVRDDDGRVRIRPAAELFERAEVNDDIVITSDGGPVGSATLGKERASLPGWEALSLADDGTAEWQPIEEVVRHEGDGEVVNLQHEFGESTTTQDHSYVVEEGDEYVERPPEAVTDPLRIPDVPSVDTVDTVDVYEVLDGYTREYVDGRAVGKEHGYGKTERVHTDGEYVWFGHPRHGESDSTVKVQREIDLTEPEGRSLVRLLAAYITEGSASTEETTDSRFGASIAESRREWLEGIESDYERLFENVGVSVIASDTSDERTVGYETQSGQSESTYDDETTKLQMMNELSAVFFREFAGQTSRGKRIPSFVYHLEDELQQLFVETLVGGDGSREFPRYTDEYAEEHFDFETTSRELAAGLSILLTQRGRKHSLKYRSEEDSYTVRTCGHYRSGRDPVLEERDHDGYVYDLSVAENENFVDAVGGIVLHNTDSVMLSLSDVETENTDVPDPVREAHPEMSESELTTLTAAIETSERIESHINDRYDEFAREELDADEHRFQIEFEKLYRRFFQAGKKKRYAGHIVWKEGKHVDDIDITGFEYTRSDIAPITKRVQKRVIEMIVDTDADVDVIKTELREYLSDVIEQFDDREADPTDIGIPGGIGQDLDSYDTKTAHVRGAKYANVLLGTNFGNGSKPMRLYIEQVDPAYFERVEKNRPEIVDDDDYREFKRNPDVICFEFTEQIPEEFVVNYEKMLEKTLEGPISRLIEALGLSWEEVKEGEQQTGLGQYM